MSEQEPRPPKSERQGLGYETPPAGHRPADLQGHVQPWDSITATWLDPQLPATPTGPRERRRHLHLGGSWNVKNLGPTPDPSNQPLHVSESPRWMLCAFRRKNTCRRRGKGRRVRTVRGGSAGWPMAGALQRAPSCPALGLKSVICKLGTVQTSWDERCRADTQAELLTAPSRYGALNSCYLARPRKN